MIGDPGQEVADDDRRPEPKAVEVERSDADSDGRPHRSDRTGRIEGSGQNAPAR